MSFVCTRRRPLAALLALAGLLASVVPAAAAASRIARPVTDAPAPPAATAAPAAPSSARAIPVPAPDLPMRETAPGVYEGIVPVRRADGSWLVELDERFHQFSVARRAAGGITRACTHGASGLARWRAVAPPAAPAAAACGHAHGPAPVPAAASAAKTGVTPRVTSPEGITVTTWEVR
jgi:hypothetical protein